MARDPAGVAERLIREFGTLARVTAASGPRLERVLNGEPLVARVLSAHRAAMMHTLREGVRRRPVLSGSREVAAYLRADMGSASIEILRVLYLDAANGLLGDEIAGVGTVSAVPFYPRRIVERALELGAASLIIAHNHPSGEARPSPGDLDRTRRFARTCRDLAIELHDHLVVCDHGVTSLRALGAIDLDD